MRISLDFKHERRLIYNLLTQYHHKTFEPCTKMGVTGLLPLLKKASTNCNIRKFSGCTVAIDGYSWLHKGAFGCAAKLGKGEATTAYITYCVKYLNILLLHNIKPVVVLDGRNLPSKSVTEIKRRQKREENRKNAKEYLRKGMNKEAWDCFTKCVDVTPAMAREFIKVLREMKIDYVISPYEADAQLAYFARNNIVDIIITEDSDLVLFGCPKIFFKMSITGDGVFFDASKIPHALGTKSEKFSFERFRWMCILSGCDYLPSLPGIGLGRAKKLIDATTSPDIREILKAVPEVLRLDIVVTEEYIQGFIQAELTFLYQLVFDTTNKRLLPLTQYAADVDKDNLLFAGSYTDDKLALDMALGNVDIHTLNKVDNFDPNLPKSGYGLASIWSPNFRIPSEPRILTARDLMKSKMNPSSTVGMQANISLGSIITKKRKEIETTSEIGKTNKEDDELLVSMYSNTSLKDESDNVQVTLNFESRRSSKRKRSVTTLEDSKVSDPNDDMEYKRPIAKRNPFLKVLNSSSGDLSDANTNPVCLIERNKVYHDPKSKIIVKSRDTTMQNGSETYLYSSEMVKCKMDMSEQSEEEEDVILRIESICEETVKEDSQLTIYSIDDNESDDENKSPTNESQELSDTLNTSDLSGPSSPPVISLDDDDDEDDYSPSSSQLKTRLRSSVLAKYKLSSSPTKVVKKLVSPIKTKSAFQTAYKPIGLSKNSKKKKVDPKQKTISSMFAMQINKSKL